MFCTACSFRNAEPFVRCPVCGADFVAGSTSARPRRGVTGDSRLRRSLDRFLMVATTIAILGATLTAAVAIRQRSEARSDAYARGIQSMAEGSLVTALAAFDAAGDYGDAIERRREVAGRLRAYEEAYIDGSTALRAGQFPEAIASLLPVARDVPDYRDVLALHDEARSAHARLLLKEADAAVAGGDWRGAEQALENVLVAQPGREDIAKRLVEIRREHAPIVYTRDHRLYTAGPDLTDERLVTNEVSAAWPVWNPDRTRVAFVSPDGATAGTARRLMVIEADGGDLRELASGLRPYSWPVWSPDGRKIAYTVEQTGASGTGSRWSVNVVDVESGIEVDLTSGKLPNATSPTWSPSGDRLAVVKRPTTGSVSTSGDGTFGAPASAASAIYVYSFTTDRLTYVGSEVPDPWRIAWSPTAEKLLVYSRADGSSYTRGSIYLLDLQTDDVTPIDTTTQDLSPAVWSPDGARFAYVERGEAIAVVDLDGDVMIVAAGSNLSRFPTWSPGGDIVMAASNSTGGATLVVRVGSLSARVSSIALRYDTDGMHAGPPQWSSLNPAPAALDTAFGTGFDHATITDRR